MTGQPSVVEVLAAHQHRPIRWECSCGNFHTYQGDLSERLDALAQHQAEALAAAGLLASGPTPAVGPTRESDAAHCAHPGGGDADAAGLCAWHRAETKGDDRG